MPTAIYDSSLLTQRKRDKLIAQQVRRANNSGQSIITPQTGYGSYYGGDVANGNITYFRKEGQCTGINPSCNCVDEITNNIAITNNPQYIININAIANTPYIMSINGSGHIYWGDGAVEEFNTNGQTIDFFHTYDSDGPKEIIIATFITKLLLSYPINSGGPEIYVDVTSITLINPEGLTTLFISCPNLTSITGLDKCINLTNLKIGINSCNIDAIYTLSKLQSIELDNRPTLTSFDASSFPQLVSLNLNRSPVSSITNLPSTLEFLDLYYTQINLDNPGLFDISSLTNLTRFICSGCTDITSLGTLPTSLTYLNIDNTGISGIFDISSLTNLISLNISYRNNKYWYFTYYFIIFRYI